jgi:hypothetical protein
MMMRNVGAVMTRITGAEVRNVEIEMDPHDLEALRHTGQTLEVFVWNALKQAHDKLMIDHWSRKRGASTE